MPTQMQEPTFWILASLAGGRRHGYAILREVEELTEGRLSLKVTTLYAALDRLHHDGLIVDDGEETVDGRRRRYVMLTATGAAALAAESAKLEAAARSASSRLRAHGWAGSDRGGIVIA